MPGTSVRSLFNIRDISLVWLTEAGAIVVREVSIIIFRGKHNDKIKTASKKISKWVNVLDRSIYICWSPSFTGPVFVNNATSIKWVGFHASSIDGNWRQSLTVNSSCSFLMGKFYLDTCARVCPNNNLAFFVSIYTHIYTNTQLCQSYCLFGVIGGN